MSKKRSKKLEDAEEIGASLPHSDATESFIENVNKNAEQTISAVDAPQAAKKTWVCDKCQRVFKSEGFYIVHQRDCTGPKPKRVPMTPEEKAAKRKAYLEGYLTKYTAVSFRLENDSAEKKMLEEMTAELKKTDATATLPTAVRLILKQELNRQAKRKGKET